jgi:hypothetical protein
MCIAGFEFSWQRLRIVCPYGLVIWTESDASEELLSSIFRAEILTNKKSDETEAKPNVGIAVFLDFVRLPEF